MIFLTLQNISSINSNLIKCAYIICSAIADVRVDKVVNYPYYATLTADYSWFDKNNKTIIGAFLIHLGTDSTQDGENITMETLFSCLTSKDGIKINKIGVFSTSYATIRAKIRVLYID